jgi:hypothetical protein
VKNNYGIPHGSMVQLSISIILLVFTFILFLSLYPLRMNIYNLNP